MTNNSQHDAPGEQSPRYDSPEEWIAPPAANTPPTPPPTGWHGLLSRHRRTTIGAAVLGTLLVGGGIAVAANSGGSDQRDTASTTPAESAPPSASMPGMGSGTGHGQGRGQGEDAPIQGTLSAVSPTSITVEASTGKQTTYKITSTTEIMRNNAPATLTQLKVGDPVMLRLMPGMSGPPMVMGVIAGDRSAINMNHQ